MNEIDTGGPSFPAPAGLSHITSQGMTLRDYFAGRAMQVLKEDIWDFDLLCKNAYELADAMLAAREGK